MNKKIDSTTSLEHQSSDPWVQLKSFTRARIAIGRVGSSLPTKEVLDFGLSHAMAMMPCIYPWTLMRLNLMYRRKVLARYALRVWQTIELLTCCGLIGVAD